MTNLYSILYQGANILLAKTQFNISPSFLANCWLDNLEKIGITHENQLSQLKKENFIKIGLPIELYSYITSHWKRFLIDIKN